MTKNIILFITVVMTLVAGAMSVSAVPLGITAPPAIVHDATSPSMTNIADLGIPIVVGDVPAGTVPTNNAPSGNNFPLGTTDVIWTISNGAVTVTDRQVVTIRDMTGPTITMNGPSAVTITIGNTYVDEGATATDIVDGNVTARIQTVGVVDTSVVGTYSITYDVSDNAGNRAIQRIRTVNVAAAPVDNTPPTIVLQSLNIITEALGTETHVILTTPVVTDNVDPSPIITNDAPTGEYFPIGNTTVTWKACDHTVPTPNCNTATQLVTLIDTRSPTITPPENISVRATGNDTYVHLGNATVSDLVDPGPIVTNDAPTGDIFSIGNTDVTWKACDYYQNCAFAIQLVTVLSQGKMTTTHSPQSQINGIAPSTIEFGVTADQAANVTWSLDGTNVSENDSVMTSSYVGTIYTIGNHVVTAYIENENGSNSESWNWNVKGELEISASLPTVNVGQPTNITFTVTRKCGIESSDNSSCVETVIPVIGASISLAGVSNGTGVSYGTGITDTNGQTTIVVNATDVGIVTATASYPSGYNDSTTNITANVPSPSVSGNSDVNSGGSSGGSSGGGGGGGGGTAEPYDNILKYESQEHDVYTTPVSFRYVTPELGIYNVWVTSNQNNIAALRIEVLKDTSKLVGSPAPGIVYKNINAWMDYKRMKNATMQFKVENSWMDNNGLSSDKIKLSKWDNTSGKWIELPTTMTNKDSTYTYFDSQTTTFSSFAINGIKDIQAVSAAVDTPSATAVVPSPEPVVTGGVASKGSTSFEIGIVVVVVVLIFYVLRLKKN